jgi:hypothetical protein
LLFAVHSRPSAAVCPDGFTENWDEAACCGLGDADFITEQIPLPLGPGTFVRDFLVDFDAEPLLPVSNAGDRELLWTNGFADAGDLALTPDDADGNYDFCHVQLETVFAMNGDLVAATPRAGVVARHLGLPVVGPRKFYSAYASVREEGGSLKVRLHLEKYIGLGFMLLDIGPPPSEPFDFAANDNFRVGIEVSEPGEDGNSQLTGYLDKLSVVGGALHYERLLNVTGIDNDLQRGQIGLYVEAGSLRTQVAFDENIAIVSPATPVSRSSWGALKAIYR